MHLFAALASLKLTLLGIVLLGLTSVAVYQFDHSATPWLAGPMLLLALNLAAAVATNGAFRRQLPLLVFHLALISLALLAAASRLSYLKGSAEITEGSAFAGLGQAESGPLHRGQIDAVRFVNEGFEITYLPGPMRDRTVNRVRWIDEAGTERLGDIEDNQPLVLFGYRFYPTGNKGFAPLLFWQPKLGVPTLGAVHLPSYPVNASWQARAWQPEGSLDELLVMLEIPAPLIPADQASRFRLPEQHTLVVRRQNERWELKPGDRTILPDGVLEYRGLRTWMGYTVFYDWTIPWLLAACLAAVLSLAWHFWTKFAATPWNKH